MTARKRLAALALLPVLVAFFAVSCGTQDSQLDRGSKSPVDVFGVTSEFSELTIEKSTNGEDADVAPGPSLAAGDPVVWEYVVTNTGGFPVDDIHDFL